MGTRSGDLDPAIPGFLGQHLGLDSVGVDKILNKESGFKGLTGTNDLRTIIEAYQKGDEPEKLALELASYRIQKYIGAYMAAAVAPCSDAACLKSCPMDLVSFALHSTVISLHRTTSMFRRRRFGAWVSVPVTT